MSTYSGTSAVTATFGGAASVDTVILTKAGNKCTVTNVTGSSAIYFVVSHPGGANPQPTVAGNNCQVLPAAIGSVDVMHQGQFGTVVNLISAGTPTYTVAIISG